MFCMSNIMRKKNNIRQQPQLCKGASYFSNSNFVATKNSDTEFEYAAATRITSIRITSIFDTSLFL